MKEAAEGISQEVDDACGVSPGDQRHSICQDHGVKVYPTPSYYLRHIRAMDSHWSQQAAYIRTRWYLDDLDRKFLSVSIGWILSIGQHSPWQIPIEPLWKHSFPCEENVGCTFCTNTTIAVWIEFGSHSSLREKLSSRKWIHHSHHQLDTLA